MRDKLELTSPKDFQKGYLTLPFDKSQFGEFVKGLLGTPQTITRAIEGDYVIQLKDLQNLNDLIVQRVTQQNNGVLVESKATIYYSDKSAVTISSFEEFLAYNEVKPIVSQDVRLTWSFLIRFQDKEVPEKQDIEVFYCTNRERGSLLRDIMLNDRLSTNSGGFFVITIRHTARSWGTDVENLLVNQIESIRKNRSKLLVYIQKYKLVTFFGLSIISGLAISCPLILMLTKNSESKLQAVLTATKELSIDNKLDFFIEKLLRNSSVFADGQLSRIFMLFAIAILSIYVAFWLFKIVHKQASSFLILTRKSKDQFDKFEKRQRRDWKLFFASLVGGAVVSVLVSAFLG